MSIISIQNFSYQHPDRTELFNNINLQINQGQKAALVGKNGTGKTTLLQAISNHQSFAPIQVSESVYTVPQHTVYYDHQTVADILQVSAKLQALQAILKGDSNPEHFDVLNDDWEVETNATIALEYWGLVDVPLDTPLRQLSGGEKVKVFLAGIHLNKPRLVIMDEPTNHLDYSSRDKLYDWIQETIATLLIVSHDRHLLNLLTDIYELSREEIKYYKGNYDSYVEQKEIEKQALIRQLESRQQEIKKAEKVKQQVVERRQRQESRSEAHAAKKSLPRIVAGNRKRDAERTTGKLTDKHEIKLTNLNESLEEFQQKVDSSKNLKLKLKSSDLHIGKILAEAKNINYAYDEQKLWVEDLNFMIYSGDRLLIKGKNGSGKTTLIKLLTKQIIPTTGVLKIADFEYLYLDQNYSLIDNNKTVYEQAQSYNIDMPEHEVKMNLARSQFTSDSWNKKCDVLSGGERMKLSLCSLIISNKIPDMLILDEPTNNLDIDSMQILTSTIRQYTGNLLVVSHDKYFIKELQLGKEIDLNL